MSAPLDALYLGHILEAIGRIEAYIVDVNEAEFRNSTLIQDAVIRQLEIIGEAVKRLSPALRDGQPSIPWPQIAKMRDKLIHDYFGVDLQLVWNTAQVDVPRLKAVVAQLAQPGSGSNSG
jgi:uncharacterized protein with HEPN domain